MSAYGMAAKWPRSTVSTTPLRLTRLPIFFGFGQLVGEMPLPARGIGPAFRRRSWRSRGSFRFGRADGEAVSGARRQIGDKTSEHVLGADLIDGQLVDRLAVVRERVAPLLGVLGVLPARTVQGDVVRGGLGEGRRASSRARRATRSAGRPAAAGRASPCPRRPSGGRCASGTPPLPALPKPASRCLPPKR